MLNYREFLFKNIGERIKVARTKEKKENQDEFSNSLSDYFIHMDRYRLSAIENGRFDKNNRHLIAQVSIKGFADYLDMSVKELVFGKVEERENFIKIVLLAIIINGQKHYQTNKLINPIINIKEIDVDPIEFLRIAMLNIKDEEVQSEVSSLYIQNQKDIPKDTISKCILWYKKNYDFFADPIQYKNLNYLLNGFNQGIEVISNLLINILFSNSEFALEFMKSRFNVDRFTSQTKESLELLIENKGQFGGLAVDWKEVGYIKFVKAFNEMWDRNRDYFFNYFEKELFSLNIEVEGLKKHDNELLHKIIIESKFQNILYEILNKERYSFDTMMGHKIVQNYIEQYIIEINGDENDLRYESGYNLVKYNYDIHQLTNLYNKLKEDAEKKDDNIYLHIYDYVNITHLYKDKK